MKKIITVFFVLVVAGIAAVYFLFNPIVKRGVEKGGTMMTQAEVRLDKSAISPLDGNGEMRGMSVGNPEGFSTPDSFRMKAVRVSLEPKSVLSDRIIIREILIDSPEITCEFKGTSNNIKKILDNLRDFGKKFEKTDGEKTEGERKKVQIDNFILKNVRVNMVSSLFKGKQGSFAIADIHLKNIGAGKDGKTTDEAIVAILAELNRAIVKTWAQTGGTTKSTVRETLNKVKSLFE